MSLRTRLGILLAAVLGVAAVVLPAIAASETGQTIEATNKPGAGIYKEETHEWSPPAVTVGSGGAVPFANNSGTVEHGIVWTGGPTTPTCDGNIPVDRGATLWKGSCTFSQAGTYTFQCYVHPTEMKGTITVTASGATTIMSQPPTPPAPVGAETTPSTATPEASPLVGSASTALKLASRQRGKSVHGSLEVSQDGVGGRMEVDLLAAGASLGSVGHHLQVRVGRLVRGVLSAGAVSFTVPLNARARSALLRRRRLALSVKVIITPAAGATVTLARAVVLHP